MLYYPASFFPISVEVIHLQVADRFDEQPRIDYKDVEACKVLAPSLQTELRFAIVKCAANQRSDHPRAEAPLVQKESYSSTY
eukprot:1579800-Amphidinium_carterae.1